MSYLGDASLGARLGGVFRALREGAPPSRGARTEILVVGHRGAPRLEAENTLPSFRRALGQGANAIETDVCATRDGQFVLWHDSDPDDAVALLRQAGGEGLLFRPEVPAPGNPARRRVRDLDLEELRQHCRYERARGDAPEDATQARDAPVATLAELLEWAPEQPRLTDVLLDLKLCEDETAAAEALVDFLQTAIESGRVPDLTFRLLSPQAEIVSAILAHCRRRPVDDRIRTSADFELPGAPELAPRTGARDVSLGCGQRVWPAFRRDVGRCVEARDRNVFDTVVAWTLTDRGRLRELVRIGVDGILTDDIEALCGIVAEMRTAPLKIKSGPAERARVEGSGRA